MAAPQLDVQAQKPVGTIGTYERPPLPPSPSMRRRLRPGRASQGRAVERLLTLQAKAAQEKRQRALTQTLSALHIKQPTEVSNAPATSTLTSLAQTATTLATIVAAANALADKRASDAGTDPVSASGSGGVVQLAASQLGARYVWAAENPIGKQGGPGAAFDCSGFTKWVYERAYGIKLPHMASLQQKMLTKVSRENLQPGDLVFFAIPGGNWKGPNTASHVGIYIGNGMMIDASSSQGEIVRRPVLWEYFLHGGRPG